MLYKEVICPICNGHGCISIGGETSIGCKTCENCSGNQLIPVPMTNGDIFRTCNNEQILKVLTNLTHTAIYSGGVHNRLLLSTSEDFLLWLNKEADDVDVRTIFDFIDENDYEHPWLKAAVIKDL